MSVQSWEDELTVDPDFEYPLPCCGRVVRVGSEVERSRLRPCINRCCVEVICNYCDKRTGSGFGPVGCRCELGGPNPLRIDGHEYRRRRRNR